MIPGFPSDEIVDGLSVNPKASGQLSNCQAVTSKTVSPWTKLCGKFPNLLHLFLRQFRPTASFAENTDTSRLKSGIVCVLHVLARKNPLQVIQNVVGLVAVAVIDLVPVRWRRTEKRLSDEAVNAGRGLLCISAERQNGVTRSRTHDREDARRPAPSCRHGANSSPIADLVQGFVAYYWPPLFRGAKLLIHQDSPPGVMRQADLTALPLSLYRMVKAGEMKL